MAKQISRFFENGGFFTDCQFVFRSRRSTYVSKVDLLSYVLKSFDQMEYTASLFCRLSNALDCVSHDIHLRELQAYRFVQRSLILLKPYLPERTQRLRIQEIIVVVPQTHSVLNLCEWSTLSDSSAKRILFADDITISLRSPILGEVVGRSVKKQDRAEF